MVVSIKWTSHYHYQSTRIVCDQRTLPAFLVVRIDWLLIVILVFILNKTIQVIKKNISNLGIFSQVFFKLCFHFLDKIRVTQNINRSHGKSFCLLYCVWLGLIFTCKYNVFQSYTVFFFWTKQVKTVNSIS